jgi:hypothetical protein
MPKLFIDEFVGISNRLETLPLAFAIRRAYGHEIILDWHELDSFEVEETRRGKVGIFARIGALRVRDCDEALFQQLASRKIILRSLDGPAERLDPIYLEVARKIHLASHLSAQIRTLFGALRGRPVVGVHIRHGDYALAASDRYDAQAEWPAVPVWWYAQAMQSVVRAQKDAVFFLSSTGDPAQYRKALGGFEIVTLNIPSPYGYKGPDHESAVNPVADLFALACCSVILATPISGYSHWAANVLGAPSTAIVPLPGATQQAPLMGALDLYGKRLPSWRAAGRTGSGVKPLSNLDAIDLGGAANTEWL